MNVEDGDGYLEVHSFTAFEIKGLLPRLEEAGIRCSIQVDDSGIRSMSPGRVRWGTSGTAVRVKVFVHKEDLRRYDALVRRLVDP